MFASISHVKVHVYIRSCSKMEGDCICTRCCNVKDWPILVDWCLIPVCGIHIMSVCQVICVDTYVHMYMKEFSMFVSCMVKTRYLRT